MRWSATVEVKEKMEAHAQSLLHRITLLCAAAATICLLYVFSVSSSCRPLQSHPHSDRTLTLAQSPFPKSSCDSASRRFIPPDLRSKRLQSTIQWRRRVDSFRILFSSSEFLRNSSRVICVLAGAGHEVAAMKELGVSDVTGIDVVDVPPLVRRADPHNLPFFDGAFDVGFSAGLDWALFPARFVAELERTVRIGGTITLAFRRCSSIEALDEVIKLFNRSTLISTRNSTLAGSESTVIIMKNGVAHS